MEEVGAPPQLANQDCDNPDASTTTTSQTILSPGSPHPLQNAVILTNMFNLCPPKLLPNIRLVCKSWHDLSLPMWRAKVPITFSLYVEDIIVGSEELDGMFPEMLYHFEHFAHDCANNVIPKTDSLPYRSLKLLSWDFNPLINFIESFWDTFGNNLTILELNDCSIPDVKEFRKLIYQTCPNMQELRIINCGFGDAQPRRRPITEPIYGEHRHLKSLTIIHQSNERQPVSLLELFSHFPSLVNFFLEVGTFRSRREEVRYHERVSDELLKAIEIVRGRDVRNLPLKKFTLLPILDITPTNEKLALLRKLDLPMEGVTLRLHLGSRMGDQLVADILQLFAKQLWNLVVIPVTFSRVPVFWKFPYGGMQLEKLRSLQMRDVLCENMEFLKYTPNLEEFRVTSAFSDQYEPPFEYAPIQMVSNTGSLLNDMKACDKLRSFACEFRLSGEDVVNLVKWMPNVEKLEMFLNDEQFGTVCENWKGLEKLKVFGMELTDMGITGKGRSNDGELDEEAPVANITNLKNLTNFSAWGNPNLSDFSIFNGFMQLPLLSHLQIIEPHSFSRKAKDTIWKERGIRLVGSEGHGDILIISRMDSDDENDF